ncbi:MAG TPA: hypothetical protein VH164_12460 [Ktedonobacteraceae bacterium]|nr:hypothetical protein [Ktedonobacteraceae bacterium]
MAAPSATGKNMSCCPISELARGSSSSISFFLLASSQALWLGLRAVSTPSAARSSYG